jgi:hypothetical protein
MRRLRDLRWPVIHRLHRWRWLNRRMCLSNEEKLRGRICPPSFAQQLVSTHIGTVRAAVAVRVGTASILIISIRRPPSVATLLVIIALVTVTTPRTTDVNLVRPTIAIRIGAPAVLVISIGVPSAIISLSRRWEYRGRKCRCRDQYRQPKPHCLHSSLPSRSQLPSVSQFELNAA